jgi:DnaJ like chaperone protein
VTEPELAYLRAVAEIFGFDRAGFARIRAAQLAGRDCDPYDVIGVACGAPDQEVRQAYLDLVRTHHPDRLIAQGMPPEFVEVANAKMAAINAAYDRIRATPREAF